MLYAIAMGQIKIMYRILLSVFAYVHMTLMWGHDHFEKATVDCNSNVFAGPTQLLVYS